MSALQTVRYKCAGCEGVSVFRFAADYVPFREWMCRCRKCGRYELLRALGRIVTGRFR